MGIQMRNKTFISSMVAAAAAVAGSANATVVNFASAPTVGTYSTDAVGVGSSSAWNATGWDATPGATVGAWQLTANGYGYANYNIAAPSSLSLGNAYASGTARYAATSRVPGSGQAISPVFLFSVSIDSANDAQITIGGVGGIYGLGGSSDPYTDLRARSSFGFMLGANAGSAIVQVVGNRSGLGAGFAALGGSTTWDQLMAATTGSGATWGSQLLTGVSVTAAFAENTYDPSTSGNGVIVNVSGFSVVPAPGALALLGVAGIVGARRRRA
jgi:MYXO-CTERM domain-containing protein